MGKCSGIQIKSVYKAGLLKGWTHTNMLNLIGLWVLNGWLFDTKTVYDLFLDSPHPNWTPELCGLIVDENNPILNLRRPAPAWT